MTQTYQDRVTEAVNREGVIIEDRLPVRLTDGEVLDVSRKSAELHRQRGYIEDEKKESASLYEGKIEALDKEISEMQNVIRSQQEWRTVQCEKKMHFDIGQVTITRLDTGDIVETRPMTREERQMSLQI